MQELEIIEKMLMDGGRLWQVLDLKTGRPYPYLTLDCLLVEKEEKNKKFLFSKGIKTTKLTKTTDQDGCVFFSSDELSIFIENIIKNEGDKIDRDKLWYLLRKRVATLFARGRTTDGKMVIFKSTEDEYLLYAVETDSENGRTRHYSITDRPVYRPGQQVHIKIWKALPAYGETGKANPFAFTKQSITILDRDNCKLSEWSGKLDNYGGATIDIDLPKDVKLGRFMIYTEESSELVCIGSFQVEEYKKNEFMVKVELPQKSYRFGETVPVTIKAEYYYGAPVTNGIVSLKVTRSVCDFNRQFTGAWDWLYGNGHRCQPYDYDWYPGIDYCEWTHLEDEDNDRTEQVIQIEGELSDDGSYSTVVDTSLAQWLKNDCQYDITAEVRDKSRRSVIGTGSFKVSEKPFRVFTWLDHGYLSVGDKATAFIQAVDVDSTPVIGKGTLTLKSISYDANCQPTETLICSWDVSLRGDGRYHKQVFSCSEPGQYRLSCQIKNANGQTEEGNSIFSVIGNGNDGRAFHYNGLELLLDKENYSPGDTVRLLVNTEQADSTVTLFVRAVNGKVPRPQVLHLNGKSQIVELSVTEADKPNFFIEAYALCNGKLFEELRDIEVPPTEIVLNVEVVPDKNSYLPGEEGSLVLKVTDAGGRPVRGSLAATVYDKSLESILPNSIPDIRKAFWKWKRHHKINRRGHNDDWLNTRAYYSFVDYMSSLDGWYYPKTKHVIVDYDCDYCIACGAQPSPDAPDEREEEYEPPDEKLLITPVIRKYFADTALWIGELETDDNGMAKVKLPLPDNLTSWKIHVWCMGEGISVGEGTAEVKTRKNLLLRLQAPRFFVEKDEVVISANVHNYLAHEKMAMAELELEGGCLELLVDSRQSILIPMNGERRIDWRVKAIREGTSVIRVKALTDEESDTVEQSFPVFVHGMDKHLSSCISMRPEESQATMVFDIPTEYRPDTARLEIQWSPSLALSMVEALPYLLEYPYGCTEQTLNRFLPALQTKLLLERLGLRLADIKSFSEKFNAQSDSLQKLLQCTEKDDCKPVWDDKTLSNIVDSCINRLRNMQCSDGGWGWFSGRYEHSWPHTTALVVQGLLTASRQCGINGLDSLILSGVKWLNSYLGKCLSELKKSKDNDWNKYSLETNALVFRVLSEASSLKIKAASHACMETGRRLFEKKNSLSKYGLTLLGIGMHYLDDNKCCDEIIHNLKQYVMENAETQTAWLNLRNLCFWYWYDDVIETQAVFVKLLALRVPQDELLPRLVKYLLDNRHHGTYWKSTRDTGLCLDAITAYLLNSGEIEPDIHIELRLDGQTVASSDITPKNLTSIPSSLLFNGEAIKEGTHELTVVKSGKGSLYVSASLHYFSLEEFIHEAGLEVKVKRTVWRLSSETRSVETPDAQGRPTQIPLEHFHREVLETGDAVNSGDLLEVELVVDSQNEYEYLLLEDMLASGTTPVDTLSGYKDYSLGAYVEYHDNRVSFFIHKLKRGTYSLTYRLRAEVPGLFSALPAKISAMYAPDLCGNSNEHKLPVTEE